MALRKIDLMHRVFGKCEGHICKECSNLWSGLYHDRRLKKCEVYGMTHSEASDWAQKYEACGMFNRDYDGEPIIRLVRHGFSKPIDVTQPMKNQISLFEGGADNGT